MQVDHTIYEEKCAQNQSADLEDFIKSSASLGRPSLNYRLSLLQYHQPSEPARSAYRRCLAAIIVSCNDHACHSPPHLFPHPPVPPPPYLPPPPLDLSTSSLPRIRLHLPPSTHNTDVPPLRLRLRLHPLRPSHRPRTTTQRHNAAIRRARGHSHRQR